MVIRRVDINLGIRALIVSLVLAAGSEAQIIYQDNFTGGGANLQGTTPDVSLTGATWSAGPAIKDNGTLAGGPFTALLPFQPQPGHLYTLSANLLALPQAPPATDNDWLALGFSQTAPSNLGARWLDGGGQPVLWALSRTSLPAAGNFDTSFIGPGAPAAPNSVNSTTVSADSIVMTLDTNALEWVWTVDFNGDGVDRTEILANTPNINYVGMSQNGTIGAASTVDNFVFSQVAAANNSWTVNGGGNFGNAGNWSMGLPPVGSIVVFGDALTAPNAPAVINMNTAASLDQIRFVNSNTYSIQGPATLTLTDEATVAVYSGTHEIGARISGANGLRKFASGVLNLSNATNDFTGDVTVSGGILNITKLGAINQASGIVNVATGATFRFGGDGAGGGASGTLTEVIAGAGTVRVDSTLTSEVIGFASANPSFSGTISIGGGTMRVQNGGALGTATGVAATGTTVDGGASAGKLELVGVTVTGELLTLNGRNSDNAVPSLSASGTSRWEGPITGAAGGNQYNLEVQAGSSLTVTGNITLPDATDSRFLNLTGPAGSHGRIEGRIVETNTAIANDNIVVVKKGAGTWTIATGTTANADFHRRSTIIEQGTLAVQSNADSGELRSRTIDIRSGAILDISSFGTYSLQAISDPDASLPTVTGDEVGQELRGAGTINVGGGTLQAYEDSTLTPGEGVGALNITGNLTYSTFGELGTGRWNYQLAATTSPASNDRILVSGAATINAGDSDDAINPRISPVQGTLAQGAYALIQAASVGGTATNSNYQVRVVDSVGNDITSGLRQTFSVSNSATSINLNVTGTSANLNWAGTAGSAWDVESTPNWTNAGGPQFSHLDHVTFGNVANKNVSVSANVAPGSVNFSGGVGSTYVVTGMGGMTGFGPVSVNSGTVKLENTGNSFAGAMTIAANARVEMAPAATGSVVANGTLVVLGSTGSTLVNNFNDGNISEYTTYTVVDQIGSMTTVGPPDDVVFASTGAAITANGAQAGNPAPEQALALRAATLGVGQTLVVDANLNSDMAFLTWAGIAIADSTVAVDIPNGPANADLRKSYIYNAMTLNNAVDGNDSRNVNSGGVISAAAGQANVGAVTQLWITRRSADDYTAGYSKDNMNTRVATVNHDNMDWNPDSVGFYADIRGVVTPNVGTMDNVRFAPAQHNQITVNGDFTLGSTGALEIDLGLDAWDLVSVSGAAVLDGTIDVNLSGDFFPVNGQTFTILTAAGGITDLGIDWQLPLNFTSQIVNSTSLVLTYSAILAGDYNANGTVDAADYVLWRKNPNAHGGPNGYNIWRQNFGLSQGAGSSSVLGAVPEPATATLYIVVGWIVVCLRPSRRRQVV